MTLENHRDLGRLAKLLRVAVEAETPALTLLESWVDPAALIRIADLFERGMLESQPMFKKTPPTAQLGLGMSMNLGFQYGFLLGAQFQAAGGHQEVNA